jgi:large subunit ribosomal protein L10
MDKNQKTKLVSLLKEKITQSTIVAIVHYRGMSDDQLYQMRTTLKNKGCGIKIAKNTLFKLAIKETDFELLDSHLNGPTALVYSQDVVALSKIISDFSKKVDVLKIKVGIFNKSLITEDKIKEMAKLGSLEEVRASFIGVLKGAQTNFVRILSAPEKGLATLKN